MRKPNFYLLDEYANPSLRSPMLEHNLTPYSRDNLHSNNHPRSHENERAIHKQQERDIALMYGLIQHGNSLEYIPPRPVNSFYSPPSSPLPASAREVVKSDWEGPKKRREKDVLTKSIVFPCLSIRRSSIKL